MPNSNTNFVQQNRSRFNTNENNYDTVKSAQKSPQKKSSLISNIPQQSRKVLGVVSNINRSSRLSSKLNQLNQPKLQPAATSSIGIKQRIPEKHIVKPQVSKKSTTVNRSTPALSYINLDNQENYPHNSQVDHSLNASSTSISDDPKRNKKIEVFLENNNFQSSDSVNINRINEEIDEEFEAIPSGDDTVDDMEIPDQGQIIVKVNENQEQGQEDEDKLEEDDEEDEDVTQQVYGSDYLYKEDHATVSAEEEEEEEEDEEQAEEEEEEENEDNFVPMSPKWNRQTFNELKRVITKFSRNIPDPEDEDTYDVTMCSEYSPEIFNYIHELEVKLAPNPRYMDQQDELTWENRSTLVNWVVQVHTRFNLLPETLFLTINLIDRFLSKRVISLSRFQLCGAVALFIAAKYEEINCPSVQQMAYMVSNDYTVDELLRAERFMIDILEFEMGWPGPMSFLRRTSKADDYDNETRTLAKYFLEITIMDPRFVSSRPSWLAAGAQYLARKMLNHGVWTEAHVFYSGYTESQLEPLADVLIDCCIDYKNHHKAIFDKYSERRFKRSSVFVQDFIKSAYGEN
ncbi:hypothetical protein BVG19_g4020 [[Candida] boidinii]|nr:hypothetical protein BVG19_g4020 [[Candida] boidinii]OWB52811.1 hypothetical protein B5S27_g4393 [[Candida] boidinii]